MIQDVLTRFEQYNKEMSPLGDAMDGTKLQAQLQQYKRIRITEITFFRRTLFCMNE